MYLKKDFTFDAAHRLDHYHGKCEALHGHTYHLQITLKGFPDSEDMVMDFVQLKRLVNEKVVGILDHAYLNEVIPQPTAENIALWIWEQLAEPLDSPNYSLYSVQVWETANSSVLLHREDAEAPKDGKVL
ncbi:MAG: 6-carboxytetrahydropterin synthase QueD [Synergistota bacterium]|nr:6-carboxytetrahydropterin synthase QueD [Synergistota bacterium]